MTHNAWYWLVPLAVLLLAFAAVLIRRTLSAIKRERTYRKRIQHRRARLERALGVPPAEFWMNLQTSFDLHKARRSVS